MRRVYLAGAACLAMILSGCAGGGDGNDSNLISSVGSTLFTTVQQGRQARNTGPALRIDITRELLDETPGEVLEVVPENRGLQDFLALQDRRRDDNPGVIESWRSSDNGVITTRNGVVISTRGFGGGLKSSDVATIIAGFDGQGGGGQRRMEIARADGIAETVVFSCDVTQLGREVIQIVDQRVSTHRLREDCVSGGVKISNEYWAETHSGRLRKSRQWVSPTFGYAAITRLKN